MKIGSRLFLALTLVSMLVVLLSAGITRWNFKSSFVRYVEAQQDQRLARLATNLADIYAADGGWDDLRQDRRQWRAVIRGGYLRERGERGPRGERRRDRDNFGPPPEGDGGRRGGRPPPPREVRIGLLDASGQTIVGWQPEDGTARRVPIDVDGRNVGFIALQPAAPLSAALDRKFSRDQKLTLWLTTALALTLAALISAIMARQLTRPIRALKAGVSAVAKGEYEHRVDATRKDEIGVVARQFNQLAESLQQSRVARKQWVADIAHELRTPLSVLRGEIEAIDDGVRELNDTTRASLLSEISRLTKLVGDLHHLSESDQGGLSYQRERLDLTALLGGIVETNHARLESAGLKVQSKLPNIPIDVIGDADRLSQLFSNLLENALRYTDKPGSLLITCSRGAGDVHIAFEDSAPGVPAGSHAKLFERLYRVEESRNRGTGGSGLGLSICAAIVTAHGGKIGAHDSDLGGLAVVMTLPLADTMARP
ncbi:MAG: ATP-binding protein [Gammaproteobacteria bacterium]